MPNDDRNLLDVPKFDTDLGRRLPHYFFETRRRRMKRSLVLAVLMMTAFVTSEAGTISGKVSGVAGESVIYIDTIAEKTFPAPTQHPVVDQKGLVFQPHITVVLAGTMVDFLNSDTVAHNVFWTSIGGNKKLGHNLGTWPKGDKRSFKFDTSGVVPLFCNVHPEMSAYIVVVPTAYFATSDQAGNYKVENVPDGSYTVTAWHEGAKNQSKPVTASGDSKVDFTLSK
jgi:plastocyanin